MKYSINEKFFEIIDSKEKAYWFGFLCADGCVRDDGVIEVSLQEGDCHHIEKFKNILSSSHPIKHRVINNKHDVVRFSFCSKKIANDLINNGCVPRKSLILSFPKNSINNGIMSHFIRGYFDGDGGVHYSEHTYFNKNRNKNYLMYKFVAYFSGNENFLCDLKQYLEGKNISVSKIYKDKRSNNCSIEIKGKENLLRFYKYIYCDCYENKLDRKFVKFNNIFNNKDLKINQVRPSKIGENR